MEHQIVASMAEDAGIKLYQTYAGLTNPQIIKTWVQESEYRALVSRRGILFELVYEKGFGIDTLALVLATFLAHLGNYFADYEVKFYAPTINMPKEFWTERRFAQWSDEMTLRMAIKIQMR